MKIKQLIFISYIVIAIINLIVSSPALADDVTKSDISHTHAYDDNGHNDLTDLDQASTSENSIWRRLWGEPTPTSLYLGMASFHLRKDSRDDRWNNNLIAGSYRGIFAGALENSFDKWAAVAGVERLWATYQLSENVHNELGYRLGLITGYDEKMLSIAEHTPVLPFLQLVDNVMWKHVGIQLSWCFVVVSAGFVIHF